MMILTGLSNTIDVLNAADISHIGTYKTQEEHDNVMIKYTKGVKIAFLDYTNFSKKSSIPSDKAFAINAIDEETIKKDLENVKTHNPDLIVVSMNWGSENATKVTQTQKDLADFLFQNGVDIILGNGPKSLQPMEKRTVTLEDGSTKDGFVIYSLGSFISDGTSSGASDSIILKLTLTKHIDDGRITIDSVDYIPIYMYTQSDLDSQKLKIVDLNKEITNYEGSYDLSIGEKNYKNFKNQLKKIKTGLGEK